MDEKISILLADDNIEFGELLSEYIDAQEGLEVIDIARDGLETIDKIISLIPDVVVLDIIMPNLDGIGVLERVSVMKLEKKPLIIMLSAIGQDGVIQKAIELGAEYFLIKPFDVDILIKRIRQIYKERYLTSFSKSKTLTDTKPVLVSKIGKSDDLEIEVTNLMRDIGVPPHLAGYQYIREAIILSLNNPKVFDSVTKVLYPTVGKKFGTSSQRVERTIRNAIETTWIRGNHDSIDSLFGYTINYGRGKPTNSEFIAMMVDKLRSYMIKK
jgi:two-component system, response regulator, stage 0 sporulation protein A